MESKFYCLNNLERALPNNNERFKEGNSHETLADKETLLKTCILKQMKRGSGR